MLEGFLPRILPPDLAVRYLVFDGKQDLEQQLVKRLSGYRIPGAQFVILRDKDASDCVQVKQALVSKCKQSGKERFLVRIACYELESWYLADLAAVEKALDLPNLSTKQSKAKYREPDLLANAAEELEKLTAFRYQKIAGSRAIGPYLDAGNIRSKSFAVFVKGIRFLISSNQQPQ